MEGKHSVNKKDKKKLEIVVVLIIIAIIIAIAQVVVRKVYLDANEPKEIIDLSFNALKEVNIDEVNKYLNYSELISILDEKILNKEEMREIGLDKEFFKDLSWNIEKIEKQENEVIAIVEVTNKDFKEITTNWIKKIVNEKAEGKSLTNKVCIEKLKESASDPELPTKTVIKKITLKNDDGWKIVIDDELGNAIFPGIESVNSIISEIE